MRNKFLVLIFVLELGLIKAQSYVSFPDSNAVWNEIEYYMGYCIPPEYCRHTYFFDGDTIINSQSYYKVYTSDSSSISYIGGLREQDKRIYFYDQYCLNSILLYDFNLNVGDSMLVPYNLCEISLPTYIHVVSIDSILLEDMSYRKRINFNNYGWSWIEGIGSNNGLLYPYFQGVACACYMELVCFEHNNSILYSDETKVSCFDFLVSDNDIRKSLNLFRVYPNPTHNHSLINFESKSGLINRIEFYDMLGKRIKTVRNINDKNIQLQKDDFKTGIYIFKVLLLNERNIFGKLIIE